MLACSVARAFAALLLEQRSNVVISDVLPRGFGQLEEFRLSLLSLSESGKRDLKSPQKPTSKQCLLLFCGVIHSLRTETHVKTESAARVFDQNVASLEAALACKRGLQLTKGRVEGCETISAENPMHGAYPKQWKLGKPSQTVLANDLSICHKHGGPRSILPEVDQVTCLSQRFSRERRHESVRDDTRFAQDLCRVVRRLVPPLRSIWIPQMKQALPPREEFFRFFFVLVYEKLFGDTKGFGDTKCFFKDTKNVFHHLFLTFSEVHSPSLTDGGQTGSLGGQGYFQ